MDETIKLNLDLINKSDCADLSIEISLNGQCFYNKKVLPGCHSIEQTLELNKGEHTLDIVLNGKTFDHTKIDQNNNIISDVLIEIANVKLDNIDIDQLLYDHAKYTHNNNGTTELAEHEFYGPMGCNGRVTLKFTSPFYLWLLENM